MNPPSLARRDDALFVDFDGTLVDLAPTPDAVTVHPELPVLLVGRSRCAEQSQAARLSRKVEFHALDSEA